MADEDEKPIGASEELEYEFALVDVYVKWSAIRRPSGLKKLAGTMPC